MNSRYVAPETKGILWIVVNDNIDDLAPNGLNKTTDPTARIIAHHTTLVYGQSMAELPEPLRALIDQPFELVITGSACNPEMGIQAYTVNLPDELKQLSGKAHPHITHFQGIRNGQPVSAVVSNDMLASGNYSFIPLAEKVSATVRFCPLEHIAEQENADRKNLMVKRLARALDEISQAEAAALTR